MLSPQLLLLIVERPAAPAEILIHDESVLYHGQIDANACVTSSVAFLRFKAKVEKLLEDMRGGDDIDLVELVTGIHSLSGAKHILERIKW